MLQTGDIAWRMSGSDLPLAPVSITAGRYFRFAGWLIVLLVFLSLISFLSRWFLPGQVYRLLREWFDLDREANLPTLFSSVQLLLAGGVSWLAARRSPFGLKARWLLLAGGFVFMAVDESIKIHENLNQLEHLKRMTLFQPLVQLGFRWVWVIPGAFIVCVAGVMLITLLRALPRPVAFQFLGAGGLYAFAILGIETLGGTVVGAQGWDSFTYLVCYTSEETCEMFAIAWYIRTVLQHIGPVAIETVSPAEA